MCSVENINNTVIIALAGVFDIELADRFEELVNDAIEAGKEKIIVDFKVNDISFQASGLLIGCCKRCQQKNIQFLLVCHSKKIIGFFEKKGLRSMLEIFPTLGEAMNKEVQMDGKEIQKCSSPERDADTKNG